jgi:hypothetical protein
MVTPTAIPRFLPSTQAPNKRRTACTAMAINSFHDAAHLPSPTSCSPAMPFFANSNSVQVNGGNFYDIAGNIDIQQQLALATSANQQHLSRAHDDSHPERTSGAERWDGTSHPSSSGVQRIVRDKGGTRHTPYSTPAICMFLLILIGLTGAATRPQIFSRITHNHENAEASLESGAWIVARTSTSSTAFSSGLGPPELHGPRIPPILDWTGYIPSVDFPRTIQEINGFPMIQCMEQAGAPPRISLRESVPSEPRTTINGGTFVNHHVDRGERGTSGPSISIETFRWN